MTALLEREIRNDISPAPENPDDYPTPSEEPTPFDDAPWREGHPDPKEGEFPNGPGPVPTDPDWPDAKPQPDTAPPEKEDDPQYGNPFQVGNPGQPGGPELPTDD